VDRWSIKKSITSGKIITLKGKAERLGSQERGLRRTSVYERWCWERFEVLRRFGEGVLEV